MSDEARRRAFEPFFTTKPPGKGTGLGLAQIYGFAYQSGGSATIESAPGEGTEVAILLPRSSVTSAETRMYGNPWGSAEDDPAPPEFRRDRAHRRG